MLKHHWNRKRKGDTDDQPLSKIMWHGTAIYNAKGQELDYLANKYSGVFKNVRRMSALPKEDHDLRVFLLRALRTTIDEIQLTSKQHNTSQPVYDLRLCARLLRVEYPLNNMLTFQKVVSAFCTTCLKEAIAESNVERLCTWIRSRLR